MEIFNQFGIKPVLLIAQVVNFLILLFILKRFLYKPILKVLEERKKKIAESLKNAEEIENRLLKTNEEVEKILAKALEESQKIINESKETGMGIIEDSKVKAGEIIRKASEQAKEITRLERVKLQQEIKENIAGIVGLVLEKVTGEAISENTSKQLIEKEIKNLS